MTNLRKQTIIEFTTFLIKESRKNYISYTIKKDKDNTQLTYENALKKIISISTSNKNMHISFPNSESNEYPMTKEGIINAKRDLIRSIA